MTCPFHDQKRRIVGHLLLIGLAVMAGPWVAYGETPAEIRAKLVGIWEAAPALDEDMLQADANANIPYVHAQAVGVRQIYNFAADGKCTIVLVHRVGPEDGTTIDRLVADTIKADWVVLSVDPKDVKIRVTRPPLKPGTPRRPIDQTLIFDGNDAFSMDAFDMVEKGFRSPMLFRRNVGECARQWIAQNCTAGPNEQFTQDMNAAISKFDKNEEDFSLCLGGHLTKSGKVTEIVGFCGGFFVFELTKTQAAQLHLGDDAVVLLNTPRNNFYLVPSEARIEKVELENKDGLDPTQPIIAKVTVTAVHTVGDAGDYSVRMTCQTGNKARFSILCPVMHGPVGQATYGCKFKIPDHAAQFEGPLTIMIDFCRTTQFAQGGFTVEVLSGSYSTLVDAKPGK